MTNHTNPASGDPSPQQPSNPYVQHLQQHMAVGQGQNPTVPLQAAPQGTYGNNAVKIEKPARTFVLTLVLVGALACIALRIIEYLVSASLMNEAARWVSSQQYAENIDREAIAVPAFLLSGAQAALLLVSVFVSSCLYLLFGCFAYVGRNWARIMLTIIAVINCERLQMLGF